MMTKEENLSPAQRASKERAALRAKLQAEANAKAAKKVRVHGTTEAITPQLATQLQAAFDYFNGILWEHQPLPQVVMLFARKPRSYGYFWPKRWGKEERGQTHEIALNPDYMRNERDTKRVLSTLVHEMAHLWQFVAGSNYPKRVYHNKEWAAEMERVGLTPSTTGEKGGKRTGKSCSHYIAEGGLFDRAADKLLKTGFNFDWASFPVERTATEKKAAGGKRTKWVCPDCEAAAWGAADLHVMCGDCEIKMEAK